MSETCIAHVMNGYHAYPCGKPSKFEVDGKHFCGIHNPNKAPTKAQANAEINFQLRQKKWKLDCAAPDLLALLIESQQSIGGDWRQRRDAAIAKVTSIGGDWRQRRDAAIAKVTRDAP